MINFNIVLHKNKKIKQYEKSIYNSIFSIVFLEFLEKVSKIID